MTQLLPEQTERESGKRYPVDHMSRREYLRYFQRNYKRHHKTSIGPTQRGKTTETLQSLDTVITPDMQCVILSAKPAHRDPVMAKAADSLHLRRVEEWPPDNQWLDRKRGYRGYVLQPHQTMVDIDADNRNVRAQFKAAMLDTYATPKKKPRIIVRDEAHKIQNNYSLRAESEQPLMSGLPDCMAWDNIQRGRHVSYLCYDAPEWILFYQSPDHANTSRYAEMVGGVNRRQVADIVENLRTYELSDGTTISEFLLVRRSGPRLIIVDVE